MAEFDTMRTEIVGNGTSLVADVYVEPPLEFSAELGNLAAKAANVDHVVISEVGKVNGAQHLRVETQSFAQGDVEQGSNRSLKVLRDYHGAMVFGNKDDVRRALFPDAASSE